MEILTDEERGKLIERVTNENPFYLVQTGNVEITKKDIETLYDAIVRSPPTDSSDFFEDFNPSLAETKAGSLGFVTRLTRKNKKSAYLKNIESRDLVLKTCFFEDRKRALDTKKLEETINEIVVSAIIRFLAYQNIAPAIPVFYDWFIEKKESARAKGVYFNLVLERLSKDIFPIRNDVYNNAAILLQVLTSLKALQKSVSFMHNDLHVGNVMYKTLQTAGHLELGGGEYYVDLKKTNQNIVKLIDFGRSSLVNFDGDVIGIDDFEEMGVFNRVIPCLDVRFFIISMAFAFFENTRKQDDIETFAPLFDLLVDKEALSQHVLGEPNENALEIAENRGSSRNSVWSAVTTLADGFVALAVYNSKNERLDMLTALQRYWPYVEEYTRDIDGILKSEVFDAFRIKKPSRGNIITYASAMSLKDMIACKACSSTVDLSICQCNTAFYCNAECQSAHWESHKETCNQAFIWT